MKIKNSNENITFAIISKAFPALLAVCVVLRAVQMLFFIDAETGFYKGGTLVNTVFTVLIVMGCIGFTVCSFLSKEAGEISLVGVVNKKTGIAAIVFSVALIFDFVSSVAAFLSSEVSFGYGADIKSLMAGGALTSYVRAISALFSSVYFFSMSKGLRKGSDFVSKHKIIALFPIVWASVRMVDRFTSKISFMEISDLFFELVMLSFAALFFTALSQHTSGIYSTGNAWKLAGYGLGAALIAGSLSVPKLIFTIAGSKYITANFGFELSDLVFCAFVIVLIISYKGNNKTAEQME